ncbi:MAG: 4-alpha-glucanotransferase [Flammeovirgaceae bacterium]
MKLQFNIKFHTHWGQKMHVCGSLPELGNWDPNQAPEMHFANADDWSLAIDITKGKRKGFEYKFFTRDESGTIVWEWGDNRTIDFEKDGFNSLEIRDWWRAKNDIENALYTSAFTNVLMRPSKNRGKAKKIKQASKPVIRFQINAPRIDATHKVCVVGSSKELGAWDESKAIILHNEKHPLWQADVAIDSVGETISYKYGIYDVNTKQITSLEEGGNRTYFVPQEAKKGELKVLTDEKFRYPVGNWKGTGVAIPVFSLRSKNGMGVGQFTDLKLLADWAEQTGIKMIQILPINDTVAKHHWTDSYPYAAISVFALHPIYMDLRAMGTLSAKLSEEIIFEQGKLLNDKETVDYSGVMKLKSRFFKLIFDEQKEEVLKSDAFLKYYEENKTWLLPYGVFSYFRDIFGTPNFYQWGKYKDVTLKQLEEIADPSSPQYDDIAIHFFIQYHLHLQLLDASNYARDKGVVLKGDIPIGIYRHSADAWMDRRLFNMESQAGAPPDDFSVSGQNWGFPTYNWDEMAKDDYQWWKNRLTQLSKYFDAFRIDHILGFFRIWEIPYHAVQGIFGYFNPAMAIHKHELAAKGIGFDYERFCKPYIREHFLHERFGDLTEAVKQLYLDEYIPGHFRMKKGFETQREVEDHLQLPEDATLEDKARNERLRDGLFSLIGEVIFFEAPFSNGDAFNPRCSMHFTRSYQELDEGTRKRLDEIYTDYYYHRQEGFWKDKAMVKLPAIKNATNMLICGEDLGMVPSNVPDTMNELGILRLAIQRMPSNSDAEFWHPSDTPYMSVCSPSCHDMSTIRGWWEEDRAKTQRFFNNILGHPGPAPFFCEPWICKDIVVQHLYSPSMWAVFPIQDLLALDGDLRRQNAKEEQINVPANPKHYWKYRFHMNIEDLIEEQAFNSLLSNLVKASGRNSAY